MKIAIILGTRPEIIKMSPIIHRCVKDKIDYYILHSGQHYSYNLDRIFFEQLNLPPVKYNLEVGSSTQGEQTGRILSGVEKILTDDRPDMVLVEGDTNTVLAGALAAAKLGILVGHVEAGLRSYDRRMPEEINRVLADHCSDLLFAPTNKSKQILLSEGIDKNKIFVTGNTIVDAVNMNITKRKNVLNKYGVNKNEYFLVTIHRQENTDDEERLKNIIEGLNSIYSEFKIPLLCPIHPRTKKRLESLKLNIDKMTVVPPSDYFSFLQLEKNARLVLTDSGGVQEEACILNVPCVTLRDNTERPETLDVGSNILSGTNPGDILECVHKMLNRPRDWRQPFGEGNSAEKILNHVSNYQTL